VEACVCVCLHDWSANVSNRALLCVRVYMCVHVCMRVSVREANSHTHMTHMSALPIHSVLGFVLFRTKLPRVQARDTQRESVNLHITRMCTEYPDRPRARGGGGGGGGERERARES